MPAVAVYLVRSSRNAWTAACLMCSGVGKSGSPGPKSTTSTPLALRRSAAMITAAVGETEIRPTRLDNFKTVSLPLTELVGNFDAQALLDGRRHQAGQ